MADQHKTVRADNPTLVKTHSPGQGTIILVPQNEDHATAQAISNHIHNGTINLNGVTEVSTAKTFVRSCVNHHMNENPPPNGQRPQKVAIEMNPRIALLATNVDSVKRPQRTLMTIGGVEEETQYRESMADLTTVMGQDSVNSLQQLLRSNHDYAINGDKAQVRTDAHTGMDNAARLLRDALCVRLGATDNWQTDTQQLQTQITQRNATIQQRTQRRTELRRQLEQSNAENNILANTLARNSQSAKRPKNVSPNK